MSQSTISSSSLLQRYKWNVRFFAGNRPALTPLYRATLVKMTVHRKEKQGGRGALNDVTENTDLVLDGYPGSANSSCTKELLRVTGGDLQVANHLHSSALVVRGVKLGKPVLLVLREPRGAVVSIHRRTPERPLRTLLDQYIQYHKVVMPWLDAMIVSDFPETTQRFGDVVGALNKKFDTSFPTDLDPYGNWPARKAAEAGLGRQENLRSKEELYAEVDEEHAAKLAEARKIYEQVARHAVKFPDDAAGGQQG